MKKLHVWVVLKLNNGKLYVNRIILQFECYEANTSFKSTIYLSLLTSHVVTGVRAFEEKSCMKSSFWPKKIKILFSINTCTCMLLQTLVPCLKYVWKTLFCVRKLVWKSGLDFFAFFMAALNMVISFSWAEVPNVLSWKYSQRIVLPSGTVPQM